MSVFTVIIKKANGQKLDSAAVLTQVDVQREVNRLPYARLSLRDGDPAKRAFPLSNTGFFQPGQEIIIDIRYENDPNTDQELFKGIVLKHGLEASAHHSELTVELTSPAFKMTGARHNAIFRDLSDHELIQQIVENNDLTFKSELTDTPTHPEIIQYYSSDWDFVLARAENNGLWLTADADRISLIDPKTIIEDQNDPAHKIEYGMDVLYEFQIEASAAMQAQSLETYAWDVVNQENAVPLVADDFKVAPGELDPAGLAAAMGNGIYQLQSPAALSAKELQSWANAALRKSRLAMVCGRFSVPGRPDFHLLETLEIAGIGKNFNGRAVITGVRHRISTQGWFTDLQVGLRPDWTSRNSNASDAPAAGLLPAVHGLQIGKVDVFEDDPEEQFRIRVLLPSLGEEAGAIWARLAAPEAGAGRGFFFRPEAGDEVVVGFLNDDPRQAIVLGALYSQNQSPAVPAEEINEDNFIKGYFSREGITFKIDEENKAIELSTSADQSVVLNEKDQTIAVKDINGNEIILDDQGITIKSAKNLTLEAADNVVIKGKKVDVH